MDKRPKNGKLAMTSVAIGPNDGRKHERYYFRALATATIYPPAGDEDKKPQICYMLTRDLSRSGISVLHPLPLFQSQRIDLEFADGRKFSLAIQWVRRLKKHCYMMGCRFISLPAPTAS